MGSQSHRKGQSPTNDHVTTIQAFYEKLNVDISESNPLLHFKIVKEKRATIAQTPESAQWRHTSKTPLSNLVLAGDWTDTNLSATIEGAILSGKSALEAISE